MKSEYEEMKRTRQGLLDKIKDGERSLSDLNDKYNVAVTERDRLQSALSSTESDNITLRKTVDDNLQQQKNAADAYRKLSQEKDAALERASNAEQEKNGMIRKVMCL